jgi:hypothetical protein
MRRTLSLLALLLVAVALLTAGCLDGKETAATPETVVGTVPTATTSTEDLPALGLEGDATAAVTRWPTQAPPERSARTSTSRSRATSSSSRA